MSLQLQARQLSAGYGRKGVVSDVDLTVEAGRITLLLGHNGAGKTTLVRALFGLTPPSAGRVLLDAQDITRRTPAQNVGAGFAFIPQGHGVFRGLTVAQNLELGAFQVADRSAIAERREMNLQLFPILKDRLAQRAGTMSGGQQQMVAIAMALMQGPKLIVLDEPSIGLAPLMVDKVLDSVRYVNQQFGTTILMVEQNVKASLPFADRVAILKTGRIVYDGAPQPLADHVNLMRYF